MIDWNIYRESLKANTSPQGFSHFRQQTVDLDSEQVKVARKSRDYLQEQIMITANNHNDFPPVTGSYKPFGSFARNTKVRPLDDIDMLVMLNGRDTTCICNGSYVCDLRVDATTSPLYRFTGNNNYVNSTLVLNSLKRGLSNVANYKKAEIKRNGVAVVLNLKSYDWVFDIVPCLPVGSNGNTDYYIIPNGAGQWMKTDPRIDQDNITSANQTQNGNLIPLIRLIKYWNTYSRVAPRIGSYYLETMLINGLGNQWVTLSNNTRSNVPLAFQTLASRITQSCPDPKGLGSDLDAGMDWDTRTKIQQKANERVTYAQHALDYEQKGNHKEAMKWWGYIFPNFPEYSD